jgi:hypothetical protein
MSSSSARPLRTVCRGSLFDRNLSGEQHDDATIAFAWFSSFANYVP